MKRKFFLLLVVGVLVLAQLPGFAVSNINFTHPEVGEPMSIGYVNAMPYFSIYGFIYYQMVNPAEPYRGLKSNQAVLDAGAMASAQEALNAIFDSVEGKDGGTPPALFAYTGAAEPYSEQLDALERGDKIKAVLLLNGFSGAEGYDDMGRVPGFEEEDLSELKELYTDFYARVGGEVYPYRVIQFYAEEQDATEYFFERYNFIMMDGEWRLLHITREYAEMTSERETYIHGMAGYTLETAHDTIYTALWDFTWGEAVKDDVIAQGAVEDGNAYKITDTMMFRVPCDAAFTFDGEELDSITYSFKNAQSYYSAFISMYTRLADPITVSDNGDMSWSLNDTYFQLKYDKEAPSLQVSRESAAP